jgi:protein CpxP
MQRKIWASAGLALQLCAAPAFAQSTPATTPSTPPVTTPPPPGAAPPTGGPDSLPTAEPANAIENSGLSKGANSFTENQARIRLENHGYRQVSALSKDRDGIWRGSAVRNGTQVHVAVDYRGRISSN